MNENPLNPELSSNPNLDPVAPNQNPVIDPLLAEAPSRSISPKFPGLAASVTEVPKISHTTIGTMNIAEPVQAKSVEGKGGKKRLFIYIFGIAMITTTLAILAFMYMQKNNVDTRTEQEITASSKVETIAEESDAIVVFNYDKLGLKFAYPETWGSPIVKTSDDSDRPTKSTGPYTELDISFPNAPFYIMPVKKEQMNYLIQKGGCFNGLLGLLNFLKVPDPEINVSDWELSQGGSGDHVTYSRTIVSDTKALAIESYTINSKYDCNGLSVYGKVAVDANSKNLRAVQFLWSESAGFQSDRQTNLDQDDLSNFKLQPEKYFSNNQLEQLKAVIDSIESY